MKQERPDLFAYLPGARFLIAGRLKRFRKLCRERKIEIKTFYNGDTRAWVRRDDPDESGYKALVEAGFERLAPLR
jgi:hypothetical protein